jgi:transcriptional regulator with XRE-family HTH domain
MNERTSMKHRLREALLLRNKRPVDMAKDLKISRSAVSQYLSGVREIKDSKKLYAVAKYLDVSEAWLMGFDVPMERQWEKDIEEKPVETANKLADLFLGIEIKETDAEVKLMLEEYNSLDDAKKAQVREYVHFLSTRS